MPILLVRHAKAGNRQDWAGDDRLRPLSPTGATQADELAKRLAPYQPVRVLASPFVRCRQTVEPLAEAAGVEVEDCLGLAEGRSQEAVALIRRLVADAEETSIVMCSHGDVIAEVLDYFAAEGELHLRRARRCAKGSTWVLEVSEGRLVRATYLASRDSSASRSGSRSGGHGRGRGHAR